MEALEEHLSCMDYRTKPSKVKAFLGVGAPIWD